MTQRQYVENQLIKNGKITRNECLREFITRLGAIICDMNKNGYLIEGNHLRGAYKTRWGMKNDYVYTVKVKPTNKIYTKEEI